MADSFHVTPLLLVLQSADRFRILCLNRHEVRLYKENRNTLDLVELTDVPATITDALGSSLTEPHQTVASYGMGAGGGNKSITTGTAAKRMENDMDRFFRAIDRGSWNITRTRRACS